MRRFAVPLLATVSAFPQAVSPVSSGTATGIAAAQPSGQATPLTATRNRVTYSIGPGEGITLKLEERGTFARNSVGDEAAHLKVIRDGHAAPGSSVISQRKEGFSYLIDDARQQYRVVPWSESLAVLTNEARRQSTPAVTRTIDGINCVAVPVQEDTGKIVGKAWVSPEYRIKVRSEMDVLSPQTGAVIGLVVEELTEIHIGAAPDPSEFTIPAGYKLLGGSTPH